MELQIKYGVPASITLAQALLESSKGTSRQAQVNNNYFGLRRNGRYVAFGNAKDSFYYYVRTVTGGSAFRRNTAGIPTSDPNRYLNAICRSGYAEDKFYHGKIVNIINKMDLTQFDRQATAEAQRRGVREGYLRGSKKCDDYHPYKEIDENGLSASSVLENDMFQQYAQSQNGSKDMGYTKFEKPLTFIAGTWSMPVPSTDWEITGIFGKNRRGDAQVKAHKHGGIDFRTRDHDPNGHVSALATEDHGKVIFAGGSKTAGNMVKIEYDRPTGEKIVCTYMHLSKIKVHVGEEVNAGKEIGITGNTGHSHGAHLHFEVARNGNRTDPVEYLSEIGIRGGFNPHLVDVNTHSDLTAKYEKKMGIVGGTQQMAPQQGQLLAQLTQSGNPNDWMNLLMQQNQDVFQGEDLMACIFSAAVHTMRTFALAIAAKDVDEQLAANASEDAKPSEDVDNKLEEGKTKEKATELQHAASTAYDATESQTMEKAQSKQLA